MGRPFAALLNEFRKLLPRVTRPQTFLEVAGYPHYESVCSNLLAFFFDPKNPHGFGSLLLDALAAAGPIDGVTEGVYVDISAEQEALPDAGNRIDILIESDATA
jgi:hypothetical protein